MFADQLLNVGRKSSMVELIYCLGGGLQLRIKNISSYTLSLFRFSIKPLPSNLKKQSKSKLSKKENNVDNGAENSKTVDIIRIEICSEKMNTLLAHRLICAADVRCLDMKSKLCMQALCLNTCLHKPTFLHPASQLLDELKLADLPLLTEKL